MAYERQHRYERKKAAEVADIGEIPPIGNPDRRAACEHDLERFLQTYFPQSTGLSPFSEDHKRAIGRIQRCVLDGGLFVQAFPRSFAKTTISENSAIWAVLYAHRRFVPIFGAGAKQAEDIIDSIKMELSENDLLYEDFPEVCHAIRKLEGKPQRCASQTHAGKQTHIEWRADTIVLPTIDGSNASGAILTSQGILSASRGMKHKRPDGTQQRPDFFIVDDPQTEESANTSAQVEKRLNVIRKSIMRLGGHNRRIAGVVNATVIKPDDMVEQLLNRKKFPAWQGERIKMVQQWPKSHEKLWLEDYARLRNTYDADDISDQQRAWRDATEFYNRNREKMDEGGVVTWKHCYGEGELSALQHAYNIYIDDGPEVFASECQNEPKRDGDENSDERLRSDEVASKLNNYARGQIPASVSRLIIFIDPKQEVLYWTACGFTEDYTGYIPDYGTYPDQKRNYFHSRDVAKGRNSLKKIIKGGSVEENIYVGLERLVDSLMSREWKRDDGALLKPDRILIDGNWGRITDTVYLFCRQSPHAAVLMPARGRYVGATTRRFNDYPPKAGERRGPGWRIPPVSGKKVIRELQFDTNFYKCFVAARFKSGLGAKGSLSLWGSERDDKDTHKLFGDHCAAEIPHKVVARGQTVVEFKEIPGQDNDYFDSIVGCCAGASEQGVSLVREVQRTVRRVRLSERQKRAKVWHPNRSQ